MMMLIINPDTE